MLPLEANNIETDCEWHLLKDVLLISKYKTNVDARELFETLPVNLKENDIGKQIEKFLATGKIKTLDKAAVQLTQRKTRDAWLLIERL